MSEIQSFLTNIRAQTMMIEDNPFFDASLSWVDADNKAIATKLPNLSKWCDDYWLTYYNPSSGFVCHKKIHQYDDLTIDIYEFDGQVNARYANVVLLMDSVISKYCK